MLKSNNIPVLADYEPIIGQSGIEELHELAGHLRDKRIVMVNATRVGGGVAEILNRMVPLFLELGLKIRWEIMEANDAFYRVTKQIHNALHGQGEPLTSSQMDLFMEVNRKNRESLKLDDDIVFIHDPQPVAMVVGRKPAPKSRWLWRCHIDLSRPVQAVWEMLEPYIKQYDAVVFSAAPFSRQLPMRQLLIPPAIDPLSNKNKDLTQEEINEVLTRLEIPTDCPIVTQVSRFDRLKDPVGVIEAFRRIRRSVRCRLVLAGGTADDDPEGEEVLSMVKEKAAGDPEIHLLMLPPNSDIEINALQRASSVVIQKSLKEGFGLTVSEALWKSRPVVASAVGGIPLQVKHRYSGLLVHSIEGTAYAVKQLLNNPDYAKHLGENGREHVRQNFLSTRHLGDYLSAFVSLEHASDTIYL